MLADDFCSTGFGVHAQHGGKTRIVRRQTLQGAPANITGHQALFQIFPAMMPFVGQSISNNCCRRIGLQLLINIGNFVYGRRRCHIQILPTTATANKSFDQIMT